MERNDQNRSDTDRPGGVERTDYTSRETKDGREGFRGGERISEREDFTGRENVTEERQDRAIPADGRGLDREQQGG